MSHPDIGLIEYPGTPTRLSRTPGRVESRSPRLGEHTEEVLVEWAELREVDVMALQICGAVWQPDTAPRPSQNDAGAEA